ncbi:hypothetical protein D9619_007209 [Psilocybe cf. subviscida]|uniref:F-box domain-containing protein n=1 Tax=Psilocybe cf. subviscida TaxID=2480587 RepID=A0A8H5B1X8_9AGAR|nr:hypothetical protein D9619_007209 [Psilocybe cf. subviscida]
MLSLISLPVDILIIVLEPLDFDDLTALSLSCRLLHSVVTEYGWTNYLRDHPRPSWSLSRARNRHWSPHARVYYDVMADRGWAGSAASSKFIARPLSRIWPGKLQPVLAINNTRLVVGAGSNLYSYIFGASPHPGVSPPVQYEGTISLLPRFGSTATPVRPRNITAISFVADGGLDATLHVAFQDGAIERVQLINSDDALTATRSSLPPMPNGDFVESISSASDIVLSLSSAGHARLSPISSSSSILASSSSSEDLITPYSSSSIDLKARSWASTLSLRASTPYAAFGTASTTPLNVHTIHQDGQLSALPTAVLHTKHAGAVAAASLDIAQDKLPSSAVYGLAQGPPDSPWGASPDVLVSGWYDGAVRCYDLRAAAHADSSVSSSAGRTPVHTPVLTLQDRWSLEPIYSVACGGGSGAHIAAGTARHSVVSFWDVRYCNTESGYSNKHGGWSVYAPGNDPSPVYAVVLESSRFFGVTQSRPFVYDFGPGVSLDTYPPIPQGRGVDNLKQKKGASRATYHVLRREHNSSAVCSEH